MIEDVYPLVICYIAIENTLIILNFPIKNGDFPELCKRLPEDSCWMKRHILGDNIPSTSQHIPVFHIEPPTKQFWLILHMQHKEI